MPGLTDIEAAAVAHCGSTDWMPGRVTSWSLINSGSRNLDGLAKMAAELAELFGELPGKMRLREPAPVEAMMPDGTLAPVSHGRNLHVAVRPKAPIQLLFTGHMDTVFGSDHWFQDVTLDDDIIRGPGVADMKGGLSVMHAALLAVEHVGVPNLGYEVVINSDEEVGSSGSAPLIAAAARGKVAALTYEPSTLPDGTLAGARPGSGNFSIRIEGRSAHAGRNPDEGRNAVLAAADLALRLAELKRPGLTVNPAKIDGGGPNNVVPDKAVLRVNMRPQTPEDQARAEAELDEAIASVSVKHDVRMHRQGGFGRPPKPIDPRAKALLELVKRSGADLGQEIGWRDTGGVCDGNNIAACGVPVVDTMGARGGAIHSDQEYLIVESLQERAQLSALTILRLANGEAMAL